jgi:hypothetical protein
MGPVVNVFYRGEAGDTERALRLNDKEARHIGLDRNAYGPPETGGYVLYSPTS